jgi:hypothetical protein
MFLIFFKKGSMGAAGGFRQFVQYHQYGIIVYHTDLQETVGSNVLILFACPLRVTTSTNVAI